MSTITTTTDSTTFTLGETTHTTETTVTVSLKHREIRFTGKDEAHITIAATSEYSDDEFTVALKHQHDEPTTVVLSHETIDDKSIAPSLSLEADPRQPSIPETAVEAAQWVFENARLIAEMDLPSDDNYLISIFDYPLFAEHLDAVQEASDQPLTAGETLVAFTIAYLIHDRCVTLGITDFDAALDHLAQ